MIISSADIYKKDVSTERVFFYVFFMKHILRVKREDRNRIY